MSIFFQDITITIRSLDEYLTKKNYETEIKKTLKHVEAETDGGRLLELFERGTAKCYLR